MEQANPSVHPQRSERVWEIRDHKGKVAHPTGFEPVTSAFGGNMASSAKKRKEPPMPAYLSVNAKQFEFLLRRSYSSPRHSFRPRAYVVLTREETVGSEEAHA